LSFYHSLDDTIAAQASAPGGGARAILRLSGPASVASLETLFRDARGQPFRERSTSRVVPGEMLLEDDRPGLPCDLYYWPPGSGYTGQRAVELHTFGCPPLVEHFLERLFRVGVRSAQPGEFTLRAFLAGRLDLTQAEAVLGVIEAGTRYEMEVALAQLAGGLGHPLSELRHHLVETLAHLEAGFDFVEEDISFLEADQLREALQRAMERLEATLEQLRSRGGTDSLPRIVLTGRPNAGKSSLFNALVEGGPGAIVSPEPGTTRDFLEAELELDGLRCRLIDTAGIEPRVTDRIAAEAQRHTNEQSLQADLELRCVEIVADGKFEVPPAPGENAPPRLLVRTKCDRPTGPHETPTVELVETSARTGWGCAALRQAIRRKLLGTTTGEVVPATAVRCREALESARDSLKRAKELAEHGSDEVLVAAELRGGLDRLGEVVGAVHTEDLLESIFSRFCVGK
jgi:tRNA modification GTPase